MVLFRWQDRASKHNKLIFYTDVERNWRTQSSLWMSCAWSWNNECWRRVVKGKEMLTEFCQPLQVQSHLEMPRILVQLGHIQRT